MAPKGERLRDTSNETKVKRKKNALERAQLEYAQLEVQFKPLIENVQGKIDRVF